MARNREPNFRGDDSEPSRELPNALEAEMALLGAVFMSNDVIDRMPSALTESHFYDKLNGAIFSEMTKLRAAGKNISPITVKSSLPDAPQKVGDLTFSQYLARLAADAVGASTASDNAFAVIDTSQRRLLLSGAEWLSAAAYKPDEEMVETVKASIDGLNNILAERSGDTERERPGDAYLRLFSGTAMSSGTVGVPLPLKEISDVLSEPVLEAGNLYGLLSSSGEGKTSLTMQIVYHAAASGHPTVFFSYDQSSPQCVRQMVAQQLEIPAHQQRQKDDYLSTKQQDKCLDFAMEINRMPLEIIRCKRESVAQLISMARRFIKRTPNPHRKTPFIVIDHIQKITPKDPRAHEGKISADITVELKSFAGETEAVVLLLNQRNSDGTKRDNPRPISRDLYGGEPAKADYDAIFWLYRPEKYRDERVAIASGGADHKRIQDVFGGEERWRGVAEIGAIKCRFGPPSNRERLKFEAHLTRYVTMREDQEDIFE